MKKSLNATADNTDTKNNFIVSDTVLLMVGEKKKARMCCVKSC